MTVPDPVHTESTVTRTITIIPQWDEDGFPDGYRMPLHTEVCLNRLCRRLQVDLEWDAIGRFRILHVQPDHPLTRDEHDPFSDDDYDRLHTILSNPGSGLARYDYRHLEEKDADVDGMTGATPLDVRKEVVEGAAYTTWVLWQWAQAIMPSRLRQHAADTAEPGWLARLMIDGDAEEQAFAITTATTRFPGEPDLIEPSLSMLRTADGSVARDAIAYLDGMDVSRESRLLRLAGQTGVGNEFAGRQILMRLSSENELPGDVLAVLARRLPLMSDVEQFAALDLLVTHRQFDPDTVDRVRSLHAAAGEQAFRFDTYLNAAETPSDR